MSLRSEKRIKTTMPDIEVDLLLLGDVDVLLSNVLLWISMVDVLLWHDYDAYYDAYISRILITQKQTNLKNTCKLNLREGILLQRREFWDLWSFCESLLLYVCLNKYKTRLSSSCWTCVLHSSQAFITIYMHARSEVLFLLYLSFSLIVVISSV